eukprot:scpid107253/ scgid31779/ 
MAVPYGHVVDVKPLYFCELQACLCVYHQTTTAAYCWYQAPSMHAQCTRMLECSKQQDIDCLIRSSGVQNPCCVASANVSHLLPVIHLVYFTDSASHSPGRRNSAS